MQELSRELLSFMSLKDQRPIHTLGQTLQVPALLTLVFGLDLIVDGASSWFLFLALGLELSVFRHQTLVMTVLEKGFAIEA